MCWLQNKQWWGVDFSPFLLINQAFSPEKAQKSGLFYITFRILIGILTRKTFTENSSSRKSMPGSDRHSTPRQMHLISDHPSIFGAGINLRLKTENNTGDTLHYQKPPSWTARKHNCYLRGNYGKTREEGLSGELISLWSSIIWSPVSSNHDSNHLHQNNLGVC